MAPASVGDRLSHISRSISLIQSYWDGKLYQEYLTDEPLRAATERHLLSIAEAVKHISQEQRDQHPNIPWRQIIGLGNVLRHGYDIVEPSDIWSIVNDKLAELKIAIDEISTRHST